MLWTPKFYGMLAVLPVTWSLIAHTAWPSKPQEFVVPERPKLAFNQYLVDLGRVQPTTEIRGAFGFENRGRNPVQIQKVTPSCGCLQPFVSSETIAPGETGAIILRMQPANELPGRKEFTADIHYTDPEPQEVRVTFRLELPEKQMSVKPRALVVYQATDQPTTHPLSVADTRPRPANILGATANSPFLTVALVSSDLNPEFGKETRFEVTVSPELPAGRHEALITIETDDVASPILRVPVLIHGQRNRE